MKHLITEGSMSSKISRKSRVFYGILLATAVSSFIFGDSQLDLLGDRGSRRTEAEMRSDGQQDAERIFSDIDSIAGKYSLLLLGTSPESVWVDSRNSSNGILGSMANTKQGFDVGQDCLSGTAYDINPSVIQGRQVYGEVNAAATINQNESGVIVVSPANSPNTEGAELKFRVAGSSFILDDANTVRTLEAYGCETELPLVGDKL